MSFILDALKKLEQKRQQGNVPDLMTVHPKLIREEEKRPVRTYVIIAALVVNAAVLLLWARPWEQREPDIQTSNIQTTKNITAPPVKAEPEQSPPAITEQLPSPKKESNNNKNTIVPEKKPVVQEQEISETNETELRLDISGQELKELKDQIKEEKTQIYERPVPAVIPAEKVNDPAESIVLEFGQLPVSVRDELPKITINTHIYSNDPATRIASINGSINHEGDMVTKSLTLEEITENGVVLNYKGLRFNMRAF